MPQKWPDSFWGNLLIQAMGGIEWTRVIHHAAAVVLDLLHPFELGEQETPAAETAPTEALVPERKRGWRVLVAEDNPINSRILSAMLTQLGCDVTTSLSFCWGKGDLYGDRIGRHAWRDLVPLQRLLGIADLKLDTAGGGGSAASQGQPSRHSIRSIADSRPRVQRPR